VISLEAPDDEAATRFRLATGRQGNVHTMTLPAFREEEMERIVQGLPSGGGIRFRLGRVLLGQASRPPTPGVPKGLDRRGKHDPYGM